MKTILLFVCLVTAQLSLAGPEPHIVSPGEKEGIPFPGHLSHLLADHESTPAGTAVLELELPPRTFGAPPHVHTHEDEYFYVLEGQVDFLDRGEVVRAKEGSLAVLPRGHLHGFWNDTDQSARLLLIISPGQFDGFFDDVVARIRASHPEDSRAVGALIAEEAAQRGVEIHLDKVPASAVHLLPR